MKTEDARKLNRRTFLKIVAAAGASCGLSSAPFVSHAASDPERKLKIGVVGSGRIGGTLGGLWVKAGHEVMFSSRDLEHDKALAAGLGPAARAGTPRDAAAFGDVVLVAVPYSALPQLGKDLADLIKGKVVIDTSNPIVARDGDIATWARQKGAGLASAELLPGAHIVRAFNAVGAARLPTIAQSQGERIGMPIASDDANAVAMASRLIREVGFEPVLIGPLAMGKHLIPGTPLAGERTPEQIRKVVPTLS
ncbi:MAG: 8-hydroxy-5-deazaflavin:NADPH oxidoreductase [Alphaproteobacteria bacterium]|jgi:predicted dinucleotide-binding enzyme|nr:8-hydroxy-5-deazaflavin:NADPH oxidoreductase [Alphaproteobacteria bacterium]